MEEAVVDYYESLSHCVSLRQQYQQMSPEQREMLKSLGYIQ